MPNYKVVFPIETTARELVYKLVLSTKFCELGYDCYIGSKRDVNELLPTINTFVYFDKGYLKGTSEQLFELVKQLNGITISLDEEGGVDTREFTTIDIRFQKEVFDYCDLIFIWGTPQYNFLKHSKPYFDQKKVIISGHPRFELLKKKYRFLYEYPLNNIKNKYDKYILICSNAGFGNNIRGEEFIMKNYQGRVRYLEKFVQDQQKRLADIVSLVKKISEIYDGKIIIRPHPEENSEIYNKELANYPKVHTIYEGSVVPWILGADTVIHADCTTGIESYMLGKKPISFMTNYNEDTCCFLPVEISKLFTEEKSLVKYIETQKYKELNTEKKNETIESYFSFSVDSTEIIVTKVAELINSQHKNFKHTKCSLNKLTNHLRRIAYYMYRELGMSKNNPLVENKLKGLDKDSIKTLLDSMKNAHLIDHKIRVSKVGNKLFKISIK